MRNQLIEETWCVRQREFQHHILISRQRVQFGQNCSLHQRFCFRLLRALDINFGLNDGNESCCNDLLANLELLADDCGDSLFICQFDD